MQELIARSIEFGKVSPALSLPLEYSRALTRYTLYLLGLQTVVHYGWIPLILFVGWNSSNPKPNLIKCVFRPRTRLYIRADSQSLHPSHRLISPLA